MNPIIKERTLEQLSKFKEHRALLVVVAEELNKSYDHGFLEGENQMIERIREVLTLPEELVAQNLKDEIDIILESRKKKVAVITEDVF